MSKLMAKLNKTPKNPNQTTTKKQINKQATTKKQKQTNKQKTENKKQN